MRKASTALLEQGIQTPSPAPDLIPAETSIENLHWHWYSKRGHFTNVSGRKWRERARARRAMCWLPAHETSGVGARIKVLFVRESIKRTGVCEISEAAGGEMQRVQEIRERLMREWPPKTLVSSCSTELAPHRCAGFLEICRTESVLRR